MRFFFLQKAKQRCLNTGPGSTGRFPPLESSRNDCKTPTIGARQVHTTETVETFTSLSGRRDGQP